jgi:hypothetical protein
MTWKVLIIAAIVAVILLLPIALRKNAALLAVQRGEKIVVARSIIPSVTHGAVDVYVGKQKVFTLWESLFHQPTFFYAFADGRRFFCDYDADTAVLDFVVDLDANTNVTANWPANAEVRERLKYRALLNVVQTKGIVRMPSDDELEEVRGYLRRTPISEIRAASLPYCDIGVWRSYADRDDLLLDLATNRQNYWPMPGKP